MPYRERDGEDQLTITTLHIEMMRKGSCTDSSFRRSWPLLSLNAKQTEELMRMLEREVNSFLETGL